DAELLRSALSDKTPDVELNYYAKSVLFSHERVLSNLTHQFQPIQGNEIDIEVQNYQAYLNSISRTEILKRPITYAIIPVRDNFDFTNLDRWYEREVGDRWGDYVLYRLKLRP